MADGGGQATRQSGLGGRRINQLLGGNGGGGGGLGDGGLLCLLGVGVILSLEKGTECGAVVAVRQYC